MRVSKRARRFGTVGAAMALGLTAVVAGQAGFASAAAPVVCGEPGPYGDTADTGGTDTLYISNSGDRRDARPGDWDEMTETDPPILERGDKAYIELLDAEGQLFGADFRNDQVEFWLDDCGQRPRIDRTSNYDFVRGSETKATGFSLKQIDPGRHLVVARRTHVEDASDPEISVKWGWFCYQTCDES